ncbi:MAG: hypothetical protein JRI44_14005 [Deltaproteobacteria bacterium]|nr:hypothetical protein [Deltaproteobacteria bacterium]
MPAWAYGVIATVITAVIGWIKYGKLSSLLKEVGEALKATGDFLEDFAIKYEDKKILGAKAKTLWEEWKDVIGIFRGK